MDPVTHSLLGASLSEAGLRRLTPLATPTLVLAANAPDIDIVFQAFGSYSSLALRRGVTHGIPSLLLLPFLVTGAVLWWDRRRRRGSTGSEADGATPSFWGLLGLAFIGVWSHPVFDWINTYGMRWLAPLEWGWSYGDAIFILDPWLWLLLGGPLFLHYSHRLSTILAWVLLGLAMTLIVLGTGIVPFPAKMVWVIGVFVWLLLRFSRRGRPSFPSDLQAEAEPDRRYGERAARFGVGLAAAYVLLMVFLTPISERIARAEAGELGVESITDVMVGPVPANPFAGEVILRTDRGYWRGTFSWLTSPHLQLEPDFLADAPRDEAVLFAEEHSDARDFLRWARFPWYQVREEGGVRIVEIRDVRYLGRAGSALSGVRVEVPWEEGEGAFSARPDGTVHADSLLYTATFDAAWSRIRETHYDPALNGIDWEMVRRELRPRARVAQSDDSLRGVIREMLARLGESHFVLIPSEGASSVLGEAGEGDPGIEVRWVAEELVVTRVRMGSAAARAGVHMGWAVDAIDGVPVDTLISQIRSAGLPGPGGGRRQIEQWLPVLARNRTMGAIASNVAIQFRDEGDSRRSIALRRDPPSSDPVRIGNLPPMRAETTHRIEERPDGSRIGVLYWSAWLPSTVPLIALAMDEFRGLDGVVLDLRGNPGGLGALAMGVGGHFLDGGESLGTMRTRDTVLRFVTNPQRVSQSGQRVAPYSGPLAILVDPLSGSTSEIFAAGMQSLGRARIFGERSAGQALPALITPLPNGDRLMHAVADFVAPDGTRLESAGVEPDLEVVLQRGALLDGEDSVLEAAFDWIRTQR